MMLRHAFFFLLLAIPAHAEFVLTGTMTARHFPPVHATLLHDGRVLITDDGVAPEIYTPATQTFRATTALPARFDGHVATLLESGRVLISGGGYSSDAGATTYGGKNALLFDPASETFTPTGSLNDARQGHAATVLADGRVLIVGGTLTVISGFSGFSTFVDTVEIYDPATGVFRRLPVTQSRSAHTAMRLPDGRVLIAGGATAAGQPDAVIFDPRTETFAPAGPMTAAAAKDLKSVMLRDGRVLILGRDLFVPEVYDPATNSFRSTGPLDEPRHDYIAAPLPDGRVLIAGGQSYFSPMPILSAEIYDPATNRFIGTTWMHFAHVRGAAAVLLDGSVLVTGGFENGAPVEPAVAEMYLNRPPPRRRAVQ